MAKGASWFKMFLTFYPLINAIPSQNVGDGVKYAMSYFKTGNEPVEMEDMTAAVYGMLKDSIDQAFIDCEVKSEKARKSVMTRWHKDDGLDSIRLNTTEYDSIQPNTEESQSQKRVRRESEKNRTEKEVVSASSSCHVMSPASGEKDEDDDDDADASGLSQSLSNFLYLNNVKVRQEEMRQLISDGFDLDTILWMMDKAQEAGNPAAYFRSTCEDRKLRNTTTIETVKCGECKTATERRFFDRDVQRRRANFERYQADGSTQYAADMNRRNEQWDALTRASKED